MVALVKRSLAHRLWSRVARGKPGACWVWSGARDPFGYGRIGLTGSRRSTLTHRAAWMVAYGDIPDGQCVCHRCDNPPCCNPGHLFLGSRDDNNKDAKAKGRMRGPYLKGERHGRHLLTDEAVLAIRSGGLTLHQAMSTFGVKRSAYYMARSGANWRHLP